MNGNTPNSIGGSLSIYLSTGNWKIPSFQEQENEMKDLEGLRHEDAIKMLCTELVNANMRIEILEKNLTDFKKQTEAMLNSPEFIAYIIKSIKGLQIDVDDLKKGDNNE